MARCKLCSTGSSSSCGFRHGSAQGYNYHGCRCPECRRFKADHARKAYRRDPAASAERQRQYRILNAEAIRAWPSSSRRSEAAQLCNERNPRKRAAAISRQHDKRQRVPVRAVMNWTQAEDAFLLRHNGSLLEAAYTLGRSYSSVQHRRHRLMNDGPVGFNQAAVHGTRSRYNRGCRCAQCKRAHADANREYYHQKKEQAAWPTIA